MAFEARQRLSQELLAGRARVQTAGWGSWAAGTPRMPACGGEAGCDRAVQGTPGPPSATPCQGHAVTPRRARWGWHHAAPGGPPASIPPSPSVFFSSHLRAGCGQVKARGGNTSQLRRSWVFHYLHTCSAAPYGQR